jgi:serpin B
VSVDFQGNAQAERKKINDWVAEQTRKRIEDLIPATGIDKETRLVLVNALYFKAQWETTFNTDATQEQPFHAAGGDVKVPLMQQTTAMGYAEVDGAILAEKKYTNENFATLFVLPAKSDGLADLEKQLDDKLLTKWTTALVPQMVRMSLPRFKIEPGEPLSLGDTLIKLGMKTAFEREQADFTGIANPPNPADRLFVGKVFHKAFVAMDEAGTEAAAATAVVMPRAGSAAQPKAFTADRPFLFFVRDTKTGLVLFAGRVADPS